MIQDKPGYKRKRAKREPEVTPGEDVEHASVISKWHLP